ncbi:hypothetical protein EST92_15355 [Streptomyces sp. TM32]|uniref:hypothetical protein n=1 Tax=Streptomyces sp. TM32 TaxID=1652669 RepID=UPI0010138FB0|nr:hypothetical protein [Streptomyces sp. TM32]RXS81884.1 hypothetical protein EST92_15355 [Streptomyces sp. TM32]
MQTSTTIRRKSSRLTAATVAVTAAAALLASAIPANAQTGTSWRNAEHAAAVVEKATGTADVASSAAAPGAPLTRTVTTSGGRAVTVTAPDTATGTLKAATDTGASLGLTLPGAKDVEGVKAGVGTVVYPDAAPRTDVAVQSTTDGGARTLVTLKDAKAPTSQRFKLDLPAGVKAVGNGEGGYDLIRQTQGGEPVLVVGSIDAPWAKDANGKKVSTAYRLDGNSLIQTIETNETTAFPVVADPTVSYGWNVYYRFSKAEVKKYASKVKYAAGGAALCGFLGVPAAAVACGVIAGGTLSHFQGVWSSAATYNKCVEVKIGYTGIYGGAKNYKC